MSEHGCSASTLDVGVQHKAIDKIHTKQALLKPHLSHVYADTYTDKSLCRPPPPIGPDHPLTLATFWLHENPNFVIWLRDLQLVYTIDQG